MKIIRSLVTAISIFAGVIVLDAVWPAPAASAQIFIDLGRVRARMNRQTGLWEIVNSSTKTAVVRYSVTQVGTSDWRSHKAFIPPKSTRMLGYDIKYYDFKITQVDKQNY